MEALEDLARTAQVVCGAPTVLIALADGRTERWGDDPGAADWLGEISARVGAGERVLAIGDLLGDRQFGALRRKAGPSGCRAVLGAPLIWEARTLGSLLVLDTRPRLWSPEAGTGLARLARMAAGIVGLHADLDAAERQMQQLRDQLAAPAEVRSEASKPLSLEETEVRLDDLVQSVCDAFRPRAVEKHLAFEVSIGAGAGEPLLGDEPRLRQILANLLSNAVKATGRGAVRVRLSLAAELDTRGRRLICLEVVGAGIGPAEAEGGGREAREDPGLAITRELVELMGGEFQAAPRPGQGVTFRAALPLRPASVPPRLASPPRPGLPLGLRILAAEDHPVNRQMLQLILEPFGFDLTFAENGHEALAALSARPRGFDLVLMGMQMPGMDGLTATRRIRESERIAPDRPGRLPIALLTASAGEVHRLAATEAGADVHIAKPLTVDSLLGGISRALEASDIRLARAS